MSKGLIRILPAMVGLVALWGLAGVKPLAAQPRQVSLILLETKNTSGDPNYDYLQKSITEAFQKELKKRVAFRQFPPEQLRQLARANHIYAQDRNTKTAAINLGLLAGQDIVINGSFDLDKKNRGPARVEGRLLVFDISRQKEVLEFDYQFAVDNRMFAQINQISEKASKAMLKVLPNRQEWERSGLAAYQGLSYQVVQARLGVGVSAHSPGEGDALKENRILSTTDLPAHLMFQAEFLKLGWWQRHFVTGGQLGIGYSSGSYASEYPGNSVPASVFQAGAGLSAGYRWAIDHRFYLVSLLTVGLNYSRTQIVFEDTGLLVLKNGADQTGRGASYSGVAPYATPSVRFNFRLNPAINLSLETGYQFLFYEETTVGNVQFLLGAGHSI